MQKQQYLLYGITQVCINDKDVPLPYEVILSIEKRGKKAKNFLFDESDNSISVYCVTCKKYHKVFQYDNNIWVDVSDGIYIKSIERKSGKSYFSSTCKIEDKAKSKIIGQSDNKVKTTVTLTEENSEFISIVSTLSKKSKNDFLNEIIDKYASRNPLSKFLNLRAESTD